MLFTTSRQTDRQTAVKTGPYKQVSQISITQPQFPATRHCSNTHHRTVTCTRSTGDSEGMLKMQDRKMQDK